MNLQCIFMVFQSMKLQCILWCFRAWNCSVFLWCFRARNLPRDIAPDASLLTDKATVHVDRIKGISCALQGESLRARSRRGREFHLEVPLILNGLQQNASYFQNTSDPQNSHNLLILSNPTLINILVLSFSHYLSLFPFQLVKLWVRNCRLGIRYMLFQIK
jgi:hypothetical protein